MDRIDEFDVSDQDFHTLNEQLKKNYYNSFIKPEKLARYADVSNMCCFHL